MLETKIEVQSVRCVCLQNMYRVSHSRVALACSLFY